MMKWQVYIFCFSRKHQPLRTVAVTDTWCTWGLTCFYVSTVLHVQTVLWDKNKAQMKKQNSKATDRHAAGKPTAWGHSQTHRMQLNLAHHHNKKKLKKLQLKKMSCIGKQRSQRTAVHSKEIREEQLHQYQPSSHGNEVIEAVSNSDSRNDW